MNKRYVRATATITIVEVDPETQEPTGEPQRYVRALVAYDKLFNDYELSKLFEQLKRDALAGEK